MITFRDARIRVLNHVLPAWSDPTEPGTLWIPEDGWEDAHAYWVVVGAREWLEDGDKAFQRMDAPVYLVDKRTGQVESVNYLDQADRLDAMAPVR